jgi:hypothetical protein
MACRIDTGSERAPKYRQQQRAGRAAWTPTATHRSVRIRQTF